MRGWALFKDGEPLHCSLHKTKRSLLIGYDMIPLRGLRETEKALASRGCMVRKATIKIATEADYDCYMPSVKGRLILHLAGWATWNKDINRALDSAAFYFSKEERPYITDSKHRATLRKYYYTPHRQKRRREQRAEKVRAVFAQYQVEIVPVKFEVVNDDKETKA